MFVCRECGGKVETYYMVHNELYERACPGREGFLHLRCLEKRLGRKLRYDDFIDIPMNANIRYAYGGPER